MWQIMWMLSLLPDWFWHFLTIGGAVAVFAAWVLKRIPFVNRYNLPLKIVGTLVFLGALFMEGGIANEAKWQAKVAELEEKVKASEEKSKEANTKIVTKVVVKREYYRTRGRDIVQYVDREITKYDNTCPIPKEVVKAHNDAASSGDKK